MLEDSQKKQLLENLSDIKRVRYSTNKILIETMINVTFQLVIICAGFAILFLGLAYLFYDSFFFLSSLFFAFLEIIFLFVGINTDNKNKEKEEYFLLKYGKKRRGNGHR